MADKPKKPQKLRARLPRGLADRGPAEIAATRAMVEKIREVYERYGFEPVETPAFEYTDALGKFLPDQDRPNEGVFSLQDDDEQWISLRYDLTAPLARYVAENFDALPKPYRSYRFGWVFRNEKPGPGRFRQFMQFDADTVGAPTAAADAEMCMMAADTMEALGIPRGSYVVKVNNRKVLDGVMESIGLGGEENAGRRLTVLRAIDKLDKFPIAEIEKLLGLGRWDGGEEGKGDFTKGAGLTAEQIQSLAAFLTYRPAQIVPLTGSDGVVEHKMKTVVLLENGETEFRDPNNEQTIANLMLLLPSHQLVEQGIGDLSAINEILQSCEYGDRVLVDPSVVRGLEYYTGPVYEVELLLDTKDEKGRPVRFGSVGGGGRYDGLVSRFRGEPVPATGFSIGVSRLQAALTLIGQLDNKPQPGPVVVTVFGGDIAGYQKMVATLRQAGIRAELYLGNPKHSLGQQMKYADKRNSPCAIIQGSDEKAQGIVQIKDLILGAELASLEKDRDEYLKKQAEAQFSCKEDELVAKVKDLLQRRGVVWQ
ncbi:histidine--tRNA ligase [Rhodopseudomonas sp.]|uniref:histidine--tRNA ligase n=1 Tax=Rhodopseudomonas sp. TaxID=1078 RepID=UPI003B3A88B6